MKSPCLVLPLSLLLSASITVFATEPAKPLVPTTTYFADDPVEWASPEVVLPPTYPQTALAKGATAVVDVTLNLKATGRLESIAAINSEPKDVTFESAVEAVLKHWRFAQSLDASCRPITATSRVRVWFEIKAGQPSISVTHVPSPPAPGAVGLKSINRAELSKALVAGYPREARRDREEADVYAKLTVDRRTGETQQVDIVTMAADPRIFAKETGSAMTTSRPASIGLQFAVAAKVGLLRGRFAPEAVEGDGPIHVCFKVSYRISGERD